MDEFVHIMRESAAPEAVDAGEHVRVQRDGPEKDHRAEVATPVRSGPGIPAHLVGVPWAIPQNHPLLQLRKIAMESGIWKGIDPDEYVRELRADWE